MKKEGPRTGLLNAIVASPAERASGLEIVALLGPGDERFRPGESEVRRDLVLQGVGVPLASTRRAAWMTLTSERILMTPMSFPLWFRCLQLLGILFLRRDRSLLPPDRYQIDLTSIIRLHRWQPDLSGDPYLQTTDDFGVTYRLIADRFPWSKGLPVEAQREQVEAVEAGVAAAAVRRGPRPR